MLCPEIGIEVPESLVVDFASAPESPYEKALKKLNETKDEKEREEAMKEYRKLYEKRSEFMTEERTGFVWVYIRK